MLRRLFIIAYFVANDTRNGIARI